MGRKRKGPWSLPDLRRLVHFYPDIRTEDLAKVLNRRVSAVYSKAKEQGLSKSADFFDTPVSGRTDGKRGLSSRFPKGHVPANKGIKGWQAGGRSKDTQFKKGRMPQTWKPIGTERISKDGYLQRKISDTGYPPRDWKGVHIILWEEHNGPVPKGHAIVFKNRDKKDIRIENLECISRGELMRRNTIHNYPPEVKKLIRLNGKLKRIIRKQSDEKQDRRSA